MRRRHTPGRRFHVFLSRTFWSRASPLYGAPGDTHWRSGTLAMERHLLIRAARRAVRVAFTASVEPEAVVRETGAGTTGYNPQRAT